MFYSCLVDSLNFLLESILVITSYVICVFKMKIIWILSACRKASFGTFAAAASVRLLRASLYFIMGRGIWAREVFRHATPEMRASAWMVCIITLRPCHCGLYKRGVGWGGLIQIRLVPPVLPQFRLNVALYPLPAGTSYLIT